MYFYVRQSCVWQLGNRCGQFFFQARHISSSSYNDAIRNVLSDENKERTIQNVTKYNENINVAKKLSQTAAVLVALCYTNNVPCMLLTVRPSHMKKHAGEVSFPGGGMDYGDTSVIDTALRETEEEIGFPKSKVDVWATVKPLPDRFLQKATKAVYPVIGNLGHVDPSDLKVNPNEVEKVICIPIEFLLDPYNFGTTRFRVKNNKPSPFSYTMPIYFTKPHIWGLTGTFVNLSLMFLIPEWHKPLTKGRFHVKK
uniref:Nucleoside diphosphate-linked moiety X motif 8, mitochondrial-like n=1 Tax=Phallusia mammillata TaxID=59560 RepID=A0A6F9DM36_9ASCI|nr:nucleoside diphosphate-linked moiety X motif 8, mitochondrial-like [Phallusia mammillata]